MMNASFFSGLDGVAAPIREDRENDCSCANYTGRSDEDVGPELVSEARLVGGHSSVRLSIRRNLGWTFRSTPGFFCVSSPLQRVTPPSTAVTPSPAKNTAGGRPPFFSFSTP